MKCLTKFSEIFGNFRVKDLLGVHPRLFRVVQKCLFAILNLHLLLSISRFLLYPINFLNFSKCFKSFIPKDNSKP